MSNPNNPLDFLNDIQGPPEPSTTRAAPGGGSPHSQPSPIRFHCPQCGKGLMAQSDQAGKRFSCPKCKAAVAVPDSSFVALEPQPLQAALPEAEPAVTTKACPFCAETIAAQAVKCKHCGSMLGRRRQQPVKPAARRQPIARTPNHRSE